MYLARAGLDVILWDRSWIRNISCVLYILQVNDVYGICCHGFQGSPFAGGRKIGV
jgi:hypothetical protein